MCTLSSLEDGRLRYKNGMSHTVSIKRPARTKWNSAYRSSKTQETPITTTSQAHHHNKSKDLCSPGPDSQFSWQPSPAFALTLGAIFDSQNSKVATYFIGKMPTISSASSRAPRGGQMFAGSQETVWFCHLCIDEYGSDHEGPKLRGLQDKCNTCGHIVCDACPIYAPPPSR